MKVVSEKNKNFDLFIDEDKVNLIGNYATVEAYAKPNERCDSKKKPSTTFIKGVIDKNYKEALFGFDREIEDIIRYGSKDFIVYKKANYINNSQNKYHHFRVINGEAILINEIIATQMKSTIIKGLMQGTNFLYSIEAGKVIFNKGVKIRDFKKVKNGNIIHYEAEVVDFIVTDENAYEINFSINEKGEILNAIYCKETNMLYSQYGDYNQIKWCILQDLLNKEAKRIEVQQQRVRVKRNH
jgi:hypothetical protein